MLLTEIDHVAIAVKDLEAAIVYYREAFGAEVHHREIVDSDGSGVLWSSPSCTGRSRVRSKPMLSRRRRRPMV